jgi:hypothetical protein
MKYLRKMLFSSIRHVDLPVCSRCKFYKPRWDLDFNSDNNKCSKFGSKNIYNGDIIYDTVSVCRSDDTKCGLKGRYFMQDPNAREKKIAHYFDKERHNY